ncbi:MAG: hypothetical protein J6U62_03390, partial [Bacteroidaceae bacterium]|nr:hypothetical protein [Bacteroidaceae bacterium]
QAGYPRTIQLDSYSIVNQNGAEWKWEINPAPLTMSADNVRNPIITIEPDQTYDITLTVTTPGGSDTKCIEAMIKGGKPVPEGTSVAPLKCKDLLLENNVAVAGESFVFVPRNLDGNVSMLVYDTKGNVVADVLSAGRLDINTTGYAAGIYFYLATDEVGFRKTGKLLVK